MNTATRTIASLALLVAPTLVAQDAQTHNVNAVVLIRCGTTTLTLNGRLLESVLLEPATDDALRKALGERFEGAERIHANLPVTQSAGAYQVHMGATIRATGAFSAKDHDDAIDAMLGHLSARVDHLLYHEPKHRLAERRDALRERLHAARNTLVKLRNEQQRTTTVDAELSQELRALNEQLLAVRLDVSTEERAREHLAELRDRNVQMRDKLRADRRARQATLTELSVAKNELRDLLARAAQEGRDDVSAIETRLQDTQARAETISTDLTDLGEVLKDVESMLTVVLEQLPQVELKVQRARARLESLEKSYRDLQQRAVVAHDRVEKLGDAAFSIEMAKIDEQVAREQLVAVETQLAQLEQPRYEVLRPR